MKAAIFQAPEAPLQIADVPEPRARAGEVVVRVKNCGICGSDLHAADSRKVKMPAGTIMGHEFAGIVEEVGDGVSGFERGEAVVAMSYLPCGECALCRAGFAVKCPTMRAVGFGEVPGAYAEFMKTRPGSLFKMPGQMNFRVGATVEPMVVGLHGLRRVRFQAGETCVIMGAGPIGLVTLLWARYAGARSIVVSELALERRDLALKLGADLAVDPRIRNPAAAITHLTGSGPDVVFECIGSHGTLAQAIGYAPRAGRVAVLGASLEDDGFPPGIAINKELDIHFSLGLEPGEVETTIAVLASGRISTEPMITHTVNLAELPRAFAALKQPTNQCKVMLEFD
ncbi:MAG TPA: alcohol dehydrogenase catalytic domain-containing protein [Candidatus Binataceae bacterium]|nr:alcohol dehydrogenase catalytic domain-containing protein [Candidatus Binataceae bacterium]